MNTQPFLEALEKGCVYEPADAISATFKVDEAATDALLLQAFHAIIASQERERVLREALGECADDLESEIKARADNELPRRISRDMETVTRARQALQSTEQQG